MALPHSKSGDLIDVRPLGPRLENTPSHALFKDDDLQVMRLVLKAGKTMPEHSVDGAVTIQCMEGAVELEAHGQQQVLQPGEMVYLAGGVPHALKALADCSVLVTVALAPPTKNVIKS